MAPKFHVTISSQHAISFETKAYLKLPPTLEVHCDTVMQYRASWTLTSVHQRNETTCKRLDINFSYSSHSNNGRSENSMPPAYRQHHEGHIRAVVKFAIQSVLATGYSAIRELHVNLHLDGKVSGQCFAWSDFSIQSNALCHIYLKTLCAATGARNFRVRGSIFRYYYTVSHVQRSRAEKVFDGVCTVYLNNLTVELSRWKVR
jgi:hypothetical protein